MLCKKLLLWQKLPLYVHDVPGAAYSYHTAIVEANSLMFSIAQGHYSSKPISLA